MKTYKVHYPDGNIRIHKTEVDDGYWVRCLPDLEKVFYYQKHKTMLYLRIIEMSEKEIWTEEISDIEYQNLVIGPNHGKFAYFRMDSFLTLLEF